MALAGVGSVVTARCGDAPPSPPWPKPKSLTAAPLVIFRQDLTVTLIRKDAQRPDYRSWGRCFGGDWRRTPIEIEFAKLDANAA